MLRDAFVGKARTVMLATVSPGQTLARALTLTLTLTLTRPLAL